MKKSILIILIFLSVLCMAGCGITEKNGETGYEDPTPTLSISDIFQPEKAPNTGNAENSDVLAETLERVDAKELEKYNAANRMLHHDVALNQKSLFCIDGDTGVVYFVNQYQDYYIYRLKDGKAELAVPMPAKELYCWDGVLYFVVDSYGVYDLQDMMEWDIYAYHPDLGMVERVYALGKAMAQTNAAELINVMQKLTVTEDGLYFIGEFKAVQTEVQGKTVTVIKEQGCHLPFGATEPVTDTKRQNAAGWGEYYFTYAPDTENGGYSVTLSPREPEIGREKIRLGKALCYFALEDDAYMLQGNTVVKRNLLTDEETVYDCEPVMREVYGQAEMEEVRFSSLETFMITEDSIWVFNTSNEVVKFTRENGVGTYYQLELREQVEAAYTDGEDIYVLTGSGVALLLADDTETDEQGNQVLKLQFLVAQ